MVVDAEYYRPLAGATISLGRTNTAPLTTSREDGSFSIPPEKKWGLWIIPQDVFFMNWRVCVQHADYETNCVQFPFRASATGQSATMQLRSIPLLPLSK